MFEVLFQPIKALFQAQCFWMMTPVAAVGSLRKKVAGLAGR